jgi:hypothetical protein
MKQKQKYKRENFFFSYLNSILYKKKRKKTTKISNRK